MKLVKNPIAHAVGACLLLASGAAFAYVPTSNTDADLVLYWGGATASTLSAQELAVNAMCDSVAQGAAAPTLLYVNNVASNDAPGNDWAVACNTAAAPNVPRSGLPNGLRILIVKRDRDGSGVGVGPVQSNTAISFLTIAGNCAGVPAGSGRPQFLDPNGAAVSLIGCPNTIAPAVLYSTSRLTEMGTSDIEPSKFFGINTPNVDGIPTPFNASVGFHSVAATGALLFNTPVTLALRNVLQGNQYATTSVCHPSNAAYLANAETEACMPSLTRAEINSILTGRIVGWNQLLDAAGAALDTDPNAPVVPIAGAVQICRRVPGSGTQATINAIISSYPCDANLADNSLDVVLPRVPGGSVVGNSGSSDVDNCLHNFNATANPYAIGILSLERNTGNARNWRYIKIDGAAPTLRNVHAGDYSVWVQQSCQRRLNTLNTNAGVGANDTTANKNTAAARICSELNSPARLLQLQTTYTWGISGWLATATAAASNQYATVLNTNNPVNAYTREFGPGLTNACMNAVKATAGGNAARGTIVAPNPNWTPVLEP